MPAKSGTDVFPSEAVLFTRINMDGSIELPVATPDAVPVKSNSLAGEVVPMPTVPLKVLPAPVKVFTALRNATFEESRRSETVPAVRLAAFSAVRPLPLPVKELPALSNDAAR